MPFYLCPSIYALLSMPFYLCHFPSLSLPIRLAAMRVLVVADEQEDGVHALEHVLAHIQCSHLFIAALSPEARVKHVGNDVAQERQGKEGGGRAWQMVGEDDERLSLAC